MTKIGHDLTDHLTVFLLLLASVCLGLGVCLPIVEVQNLIIFKNEFSIIEAAHQLYVDKQFFLSFVIIIFSIIFPFGKILVTFVVFWSYPGLGSRASVWIRRLEFLGRWSCTDVFIVALAIVVTKASGIAGATMEHGLWFFAASIPLTMAAVQRIKKLVQSEKQG